VNWLPGRSPPPPGSSDWFDIGIVSYSNAAKLALLDVPAAILDAHGAVSEATARWQRGALSRSGADLAVAVTGVAGPGGGARSSRSAPSALRAVRGAGSAATHRFAETGPQCGGRRCHGAGRDDRTCPDRAAGAPANEIVAGSLGGSFVELARA
jgi:hypothetical protein